MDNTTLISITPRPLPCRSVEDPDHTPALRRLHCRRYGECLDVAVESAWSGFHCNGCAAFEPQAPVEARRDYLAMLRFLAETELLAQLRTPIFRTRSRDEER
jgi:hypothetical protein